MKKLLSKLNSTVIIALSAVFISLCALFVSIQEVRIMKTQQKATMYPYLTLGSFYDAEGFGIYVKNSGTGLARINSYQVYDGDKYFKNWPEVIDFYLGEGHGITYGIMSSNGIQDEIIIPKDRVSLVNLKWNEETRKLAEKVADLKVIINYSSLLEDHWRVELSRKPLELAQPPKVLESREFLN